jgi:hypothetical protein
MRVYSSLSVDGQHFEASFAMRRTFRGNMRWVFTLAGMNAAWITACGTSELERAVRTASIPYFTGSGMRK